MSNSDFILSMGCAFVYGIFAGIWFAKRLAAVNLKYKAQTGLGELVDGEYYYIRKGDHK